MSDIKYVIVGDDGEHTRFPCLAMVRYVMAAAVTMLAVAVIVLVVHAVLRSEDVRLSVNNGYIAADSLWERTAVAQEAVVVQSRNKNSPTSSSLDEAEEPEPGGTGAATNDQASAVVVRARGVSPDSETDVYASAATIDVNVGSSSALPKECFLGCSGAGGEGSQRQPATQFTLHKAKTTNLRVILIASNPSGRTKIDCGNTAVSLIDMQPPYGAIGAPLTLENFTVPPQTTITMQKRLRITDTTYIWDNYGGEVRFSVKVQVNATVTSFPLGKSHIKQQSYTCQPVTVGLIDDEAIFATDQVDCWAS